MHKIISGLTCEYRGIYTFPANVSCFSKFSLACTLFILYCLVGLVNCFIIFHLLVFSMLSLLFILNSWVSKSSLASRPTAFSRLKGSPCTDICVCLRMVSTLLLSLPPPLLPQFSCFVTNHHLSYNMEFQLSFCWFGFPLNTSVMGFKSK